MVMYAKIRRMFFREQLFISEIQRRTSLSRNTIKKWLKEPEASATKYQRAKASGKLTPFEPRLLLALEADAHRPKRERRTPLILLAALAPGETKRIRYCARLIRFIPGAISVSL